jgi:hypothetical protein
MPSLTRVLMCLAPPRSPPAVAYGSVRKIENWPIAGQEEYSILALHLGTTTGSKYWLYYVSVPVVSSSPSSPAPSP